MHKTDEELVTLTMGGGAHAFDQLVVRWERQIYFLAYRMLGREEDARDVTQEACLRAFRGLKGLKGQAKFSSWLYRIALNLCRDWIRRELRGGAVQPTDGFELDELTNIDPISETVEDLTVRRDLSHAVSKEMAALPPDQRTAIVLKEYRGLTFQEIAELLGLSCEHSQDAAISRADRAAWSPRTERYHSDRCAEVHSLALRSETGAGAVDGDIKTVHGTDSGGAHIVSVWGMRRGLAGTGGGSLRSYVQRVWQMSRLSGV